MLQTENICALKKGLQFLCSYLQASCKRVSRIWWIVFCYFNMYQMKTLNNSNTEAKMVVGAAFGVSPTNICMRAPLGFYPGLKGELVKVTNYGL